MVQGVIVQIVHVPTLSQRLHAKHGMVSLLVPHRLRETMNDAQGNGYVGKQL